MSDEFWLKPSIDDEAFPQYILNKKQMNTSGINSTTPHEVFRNDTTAIEVIVKQVSNKKKVDSRKYNIAREEINDSLSEDIENLKRELNKSNRNLEETKKCFRLVTFEMGKQLEAANQRELRRQTKYLVLQLENEKLKVTLESKNNLLSKLRKELISVKRIIKLVLKGIRCAPFSDLVYTDFESDMKIKLSKTSIVNMFESDEVTYETTFSSKV